MKFEIQHFYLLSLVHIPKHKYNTVFKKWLWGAIKIVYLKHFKNDKHYDYKIVLYIETR